MLSNLWAGLGIRHRSLPASSSPTVIKLGWYASPPLVRRINYSWFESDTCDWTRVGNTWRVWAGDRSTAVPTCKCERWLKTWKTKLTLKTKDVSFSLELSHSCCLRCQKMCRQCLILLSLFLVHSFEDRSLAQQAYGNRHKIRSRVYGHTIFGLAWKMLFKNVSKMQISQLTNGFIKKERKAKWFP